MNGIKQFFSTIWSYWKRFGEFIGNIIGRLFLMIFYFTIALPFGLIMRLFSNPLRLRQQPSWVERQSPEPTVEAHHNQF